MPVALNGLTSATTKTTATTPTTHKSQATHTLGRQLTHAQFSVPENPNQHNRKSPTQPPSSASSSSSDLPLDHLPLPRQPTLRRLLRQVAATSTWRARNRTAALFRYRSQEGTFDENLEEFVRLRLPTVQPDTLSKDLANLKWLLHRDPSLAAPLPFEAAVALLTDLQRALRQLSASRPKRKALPLSPADVSKALLLLPPAAAKILRLAWVTASRIGDVMTLTNRSLRPLPNGSLLVDFSVTKTNRLGEDRPDHLVLIPSAAARFFVPLAKGNNNQPLFSPAARSQLRRCLAHLKPSVAWIAEMAASRPRHTVRTRFTEHSVKRGAALQLWRALARQEITETQLMRALKHKEVRSSLGYCPDPAAAATGLGQATSAALLSSTLSMPTS